MIGNPNKIRYLTLMVFRLGALCLCFGEANVFASGKMSSGTEATLVKMAGAIFEIDHDIETRAALRSHLEKLFPQGEGYSDRIIKVVTWINSHRLASDERIVLQKITGKIYLSIEKIVRDEDGASIVRLDIVVFFNEQNLVQKVITIQQRESWDGEATF